MLKRTPGKWDWTIVDGKDGTLKTVIVVREENDENMTFDFAAAEPLKPTTGDLQLVAHAPEMHELLHETLDELDGALVQGVITAGIYKVARKIVALLQEINVERSG